MNLQPWKWKKPSGEKEIRIRREQILCLLSAAVFAGLYVFSGKGSVLKDGSTLSRSGYGGTDQEYQLEVDGLPDGKQQISIRVRPREYSREAAEAAFDGIAEDAAAMILGLNPSLREVSRDLKLSTGFAAYPGVRLSWYPEDTSLISPKGEVFNGGLEEAEETFLRLQMKAGTFTDEIILPVTVLPAGEETAESLLAKLTALIETEDDAQITGSTLTLPDAVGDVRIHYYEKKDYTWLRILLTGVLASVMLGLKPRQELRKAARERETELLLDYADVVSRLMVYLGAGLTIRNAWLKITKEYRDAFDMGRIGKKAVYEEMIRTALELEKGVSERRAYVDFAHRCGPRCYLRLASILEQNLRTGDRRLGNALELEMQEAFEQRRNTARRLGEEAGTKLVVPLVLSLVSVMLIVTVPAMLTLM